MSNKVIEEQDLRKLVLGELDLNVDLGVDEDKAAKEAIESTLSIDDLEARVVTFLEDYLIVKWYRDNKPFVTYKRKNDTTDVKTPAEFLSDYRTIWEEGYEPEDPEEPVE